MAARSPYPLPTDSTGLSFLSPNLPHLSPNSLLLASSVTLPDSPLILYSVFQAPSEPASSHALSLIEAARKAVLQTNTSPSLLCSLLPSVHTGSSCASLYVFAITTKSAQSDLPFALKSLHLDGLDRECLYLLISFFPLFIPPASAPVVHMHLHSSLCKRAP